MIVAFLGLSAVHVALVALDAGLAESLTKALLMPVLALWAHRSGGPRLLVAALLCSWIGDVALEVEALFLLGMAGFAAAHVCFVTWFVRHGALDEIRRRWWLPLVGLAAWASIISAIWGPLGAEEPGLRVPILVYSLLLTATAVTAFAVSLTAGIGGALFLLSDTLIALDLAGMSRPEPGDVWVMVTYLAGQLLLAVGIVHSDRSASVRGSSRVPAAPEGSVG